MDYYIHIQTLCLLRVKTSTITKSDTHVKWWDGDRELWRNSLIYRSTLENQTLYKLL